MRIFLLLLLGLLLNACNQKQVPPNILLIVVDDLGYSDLHCYGNELVETPNIDRLAEEGIRFTSAYASCTVCSPTRASLMTGRNPLTVDITDWIPGHQDARGGPEPREMFVVQRFNQHLPFYKVHTPLEGRPDLVEKYEDRLEAHQNDSIFRNPHFLAMTEAVDLNVGRIMEYLKDKKSERNTVVIFTSDNGGLLLRNGNFIPASWNYPLREGKGTLYEGGLRIPAIVRWPGKIDAGRISEEMIISTDIYPTIAEVAGIDVDHEIEGQSLLPHLLRSELLDPESLYWHYPHYHPGMPGGVIREGDFKKRGKYACTKSAIQT